MLNNYVLIFLILLFLFLRFFNLPLVVNYSADQGLILSGTYKIYKEKKITLIGPPSSLKGKTHHEFYYGPLPYYLLLPVVIFTKEPIFASYYLIFLNALGLFFLYHALLKRFNFKIAFLGGLFFSTYPSLVNYSRFVWNPIFYHYLPHYFSFTGPITCLIRLLYYCLV